MYVERYAWAHKLSSVGTHRTAKASVFIFKLVLYELNFNLYPVNNRSFVFELPNFGGTVAQTAELWGTKQQQEVQKTHAVFLVNEGFHI